MLNGLMAVVDRYAAGRIVLAKVSDNQASREWQDAIAAKKIVVIEPGARIEIERGVVDVG